MTHSDIKVWIRFIVLCTLTSYDWHEAMARKCNGLSVCCCCFLLLLLLVLFVSFFVSLLLFCFGWFEGRFVFLFFAMTLT